MRRFKMVESTGCVSYLLERECWGPESEHKEEKVLDEWSRPRNKTEE